MSPFLYTCCHCETSGQEPPQASRPLALTRSTTKPHHHRHRHPQHKNQKKHQHTMTLQPSSTTCENNISIPSTVSSSNNRNSTFFNNQIQDIRAQLQDESFRHQDRAIALRQQLEDESLRHRMRSLTLKERLRDLKTRQRLRRCLSFGRSVVGSGGREGSVVETQSGDRDGGENAEGGEGDGREGERMLRSPPRRDHILDWIGELRSVSLLPETASTGSRVSAPKSRVEGDGDGREGSRIGAARSRGGRAGSVADKHGGRSGESARVVSREVSDGSRGAQDVLGAERFHD